MTTVRVEYNEVTGDFHWGNTHKPKHTVAHQTIYPYLGVDIAQEFLDWLYDRYEFFPEEEEGYIYPAYELVKAAFDQFCKEKHL